MSPEEQAAFDAADAKTLRDWATLTAEEKVAAVAAACAEQGAVELATFFGGPLGAQAVAAVERVIGAGVTEARKP